ncbi:MAG: NAAT family transporter [Candidatus Omnitrophota bacterium]
MTINTALFEFFFISFTSLFVIIDPIGLIPAFLALTAAHSSLERIRTARFATLLAFLILMLCLFFGSWILRIFSISIPAFEIAGGILLLLVGMDMIQARRPAVKETREEQQEGMAKDDVAVTPLAIPMLAGPGAITTVILLGSRAHTFPEHAVLIVNLVLIALVTYAVLHAVSVKSGLISIIAMRILTRLMGLLLSAMAVQFILNGVTSAGIFV